jgi:hypothetical protein
VNYQEALVKNSALGRASPTAGSNSHSQLDYTTEHQPSNTLETSAGAAQDDPGPPADDGGLDEAGTVMVDFKRGKRLKKLTKLLLAPQVREVVAL